MSRSKWMLASAEGWLLTVFFAGLALAVFFDGIGDVAGAVMMASGPCYALRSMMASGNPTGERRRARPASGDSASAEGSSRQDPQD